MKPRVSVVIPCYNASAFLAETVASVLEQTFDGYEVIVADDGSTDDSVAIARAIIDANPAKLIRVVELPHVGHPSSTRNGGIEHADGDLVLCLDADDKLTPPFLERCVATLDANPAAGIAYTDQQDFGASTTRHSVPEYDFHALTRSNFFGIASVFRRQAWLEVGGFDPSTPYEDWNFWIACGVLGYHGVKVHGVEWLYRVRNDGRFKTYGSLRDRRTKAGFVARRPELYTREQVYWAQLVLSDNPAAEQIKDTPGAIPEFLPTPAPAAPAPAAPAPAAPAARISVSSHDGPRVSVVVPAFNLARFLPAAIDSALSQADPGGAVEVIVVDDGSTDQTPAVLARYGDRIRAIRQTNGGLVAAVDTGLRHATGEYIALLDADDEWPRERLRRHAAILDANPLVGLVHGDMELIDATGATIHPSFIASKDKRPTDGRVLGRLLAENFVSGGASTFRASLLPALHPIHAAAAYPDWWIAACVAAVAEIRFDPTSANRYREHESNMGLTAGAAQMPAIMRRELPWRRWMLGNLIDDPIVSIEQLRAAVASLRGSLILGVSDRGTSVRELLTPDRDGAAALLGELWDGSGQPTSRDLLRAYALDPFDGATAADLDFALHRDAQAAATPPGPPLIALQTRASLTLAAYDEVIAQPELLSGYAQATRSDPDTTLAILCAPTDDLAALATLVERDPVASGADCDVTAILAPATTPAQALLAARAGAVLTRTPGTHPYATLAPHPAAELRAGAREIAA